MLQTFEYNKELCFKQNVSAHDSNQRKPSIALMNISDVYNGSGTDHW